MFLLARHVYLRRVGLAVLALVIAVSGHARAEQRRAPAERCLRLQVFIRGDSQLCLDAAAYAESFAARRGGICVETLDVAQDEAALKNYQELMRRYKVAKPLLPAFFACGQLKNGYSDTQASKAKVEDLFAIHAYVRSTCPHCRDAKKFLAKLTKRWPGIKIEYHDLDAESGASRRLGELSRRYGSGGTSLPGIYICGRFLSGYQTDATTGRRYEDLLKDASILRPEEEKQESETAKRGDVSLRWTAPALLVSRWAVLLQLPQVEGEDAAEETVAVAASTDNFELPPVGEETDEEETFAPPVEAPEGIDAPWLGYVRVSDWGLPLFTFIIGLIDGFNPCAMWVLVFLLSLLANVKDRRRIFAVAGTFVLISGLAYFAFMAAWLNVLMLVGIARPVQIALGLLAILIGAINIKDFVAFKKGVTLSIPESAKPGIYARVKNIISADYLPAAIWLAVGLAVVVNAIELLCTAGLPALYTQILTMQELPAWQNYAYLALYIFAYMLDDSLLVGVFVVTLSRRKLQESHGRWLKLLSGVVILLLGGVMLFRPDLLTW